MLRLTDIKLPLDHDENALNEAILSTLNIDASQLISFNVHKRGYDARNNKNIQLIYTLDVEVLNLGQEEEEEVKIVESIRSNAHSNKSRSMHLTRSLTKRISKDKK